MDGRWMTLSAAIFVLILILEASAQNFYPLRYGKRDGLAGYGRTSGSAKYNRSPRLSNRNDLFYGTRYGKRSFNGSEEADLQEIFGGRTGRSPDGSSKFYLGSRFGKRGLRHGETYSDRKIIRYRPEDEIVPYPAGEGFWLSNGNDYIPCKFSGYPRLYKCRGREEESAGSNEEEKVF